MAPYIGAASVAAKTTTADAAVPPTGLLRLGWARRQFVVKRFPSPGTRSPTANAVVEQSFNALKQWRSIATRYDKLAVTYRSGITLYSILIWLRQ